MQYEGIRQGVYVKIVLRRVPYEFTKGFRPTLPLILGGLLANESTMGLITARIKRHRWHRKVLKSDDVLTFSIGWRRYQVSKLHLSLSLPLSSLFFSPSYFPYQRRYLLVHPNLLDGR
jgi:ribosome biogenesis protein BMS1